MSQSNTIFGWVLFSGIVALGSAIVADTYFHADAPHVEEGEFGYIIEAPEEGVAAEEGPALATLLAEGSADAGQGVFAKCTACHSINAGGANAIGPNLHGIMGKPLAGVGGFAYSSALSDKGGNWTFEDMDAWLKSPQAYASGTKMSFAGLSKPEERANVMLYMLANGGGPALPEPPADEPAAEGEADAAEADGAPEEAEAADEAAA